MAGSGILIALEGLDGAGTTTQLERLADALRHLGHQVVTTCEPSKGEIGSLARRVLTTGDSMDETAMALLFAADRIDHLQRSMAADLANGAIVITDRYLLSSYAYQAVSLPLPFVQAINARARRPDITLYVRVSAATAAARRAARGGKIERYDDDAKQQAVRAGYERCHRLGDLGPVLTIDGEGSKDAVTAALLQVLVPRLPLVGSNATMRSAMSSSTNASNSVSPTLDTTYPSRAAILIIGAEVLSAKVRDENGPQLIAALRQHGVQVVELRVVDDTVAAIADAVQALISVADVVITTGGIGPTHDDVTIAGVAAGMGKSVVIHPQLLAHLRRRYQRGQAAGEVDAATLPGPLLKMAEAPEGSDLAWDNAQALPLVHCAPVFILPGVPELMPRCLEAVLPHLLGQPFYVAALYLNTSESALADTLTAVQGQYPHISMGSYPRFDDAPYRVKVTLDGRDRAQVQAAVDALKAAFDPAWLVRQEGP